MIIRMFRLGWLRRIFLREKGYGRSVRSLGRSVARVRRTPIILAALALIAAMWTIVSTAARNDREEAVAAAVERNDNLVVAFEHFTARTIQAADTISKYLKNEAERHGQQAAVEGLAIDGIVDRSILQGAGIIDEFGFLSATTMPGDISSVNFSDREHFYRLKERDTGSVFIGKPVLSRMLGVPTMPISRRINKPDGSFGGAVVVQVSPSAFTEFYKSAKLSDDGFISLMGLDGIVRIRLSGQGEAIGQDAKEAPIFRELAKTPVGNYVSPGFLNSMMRYVSYRTMPHYGLVVAVGVSQASVLAPLETRQALHRWIAGIATALILAFAGSLLLGLSRSDRDARRLAAGDERLRLALQAGQMVAWERDLRSGYVLRSSEALPLLGLRSGHFQEFCEKIHPDDRSKMSEFIADIENRSDQLELRYNGPAGTVMWLGFRARKVNQHTIVGVTYDITERKSAEVKAWQLAYHDPLTGLGNRALFQKRFEEAIESSKRTGTTVSLMLLDLDDFKDVNDTLGHDAGDALLKEIGLHLQTMLRECDTIARIGGDEFGILVVEPLSFDNAVLLAGHLIEEIRRPFSFNGRSLSSKASIGLAAFPQHDSTIPDLMKDADIALYRAKAEGRNRAVAYRPQMRIQMEQKVHLLAEVREGLDKEQFVPFYQPKLCLDTGHVIGFEALARWQHPTRGVLTPDVFGAAFHDPEIADRIGEQMVRKVAADVSGWLAEGIDCGSVAVNVCAAEFLNPRLAEFIMSVWAAAGLPARYLEIEVTESVFLGLSAGHVKGILKRFREGGVKLALDDFGTGFASLAHLKEFEVDHIKIDQSFVRGLLSNPQDEAIVSAVIALGASFGMVVTAEGVETEEQADRLHDLGCRRVQGYLYAKPMASSRVPWFLKSCNQPSQPAMGRLTA